MGRSRSFCEVWERSMFITAFFFPNTPPYPAPMWAAAPTDCRDLYNTHGIFKPSLPIRKYMWGIYSRSELRRRSGGASYTKSACNLVLVLRSFLLLAADRYIKIYLWSAAIPSMHTDGISHMTFQRLRVPRAWSVCVLSLRSQFVLSLREFSRASLGLRLHFSTVHRLLNADLLAIVNAQLSV